MALLNSEGQDSFNEIWGGSSVRFFVFNFSAAWNLREIWCVVHVISSCLPEAKAMIKFFQANWKK